MKLSKETLEILKNFATINPNILFFQGNWQRVVSPGQTISAETTLPEEFPEDFGIFDMGQFLNILTSFKEPDIQFEKNRLVITENNQTVLYNMCEPTLIKTVPKDKKIEMGKIDISIDISNEVFKKILTMTRVLSSRQIAFEGDGEKLVIRTINTVDKNASHMTIDLGPTDKTFNLIFDTDHFKIIESDYTFDFSKKILRIRTKSGPGMTYIIPCLKESTFG